jgi:hypothetical protein
MARQIIFIALIILTHSAYGQKNNLAKVPPQPPTKKEMEQEERNHNCVKKNITSLTFRLKKYPFNLSTQIQFASFQQGVYLTSNEIVGQDSFPRINDTILYSKLTEVKTLTYPQVDKLTDIFYNYGFRGTTYKISEAACYNPRNTILFLDNKGKVIEFIEICFECRKTSESSDKVSLGEMCDQKLDMLFDLFKKIGIEYGITKGVRPGE